MSRYTKQHYEDVARLINESWPLAVPEDVNEVILFGLANKFADLFAADNPRTCVYHYPSEHNKNIRRDDGCDMQGFDRELFLAACGLEPEMDTCPLCDKPSKDGEVHLDCADAEQASADYEARGGA